MAGLASRELPVWLSGLGVVVGLAGLVSPLGVGKDMQQYAFLLETAWMIALAVTALLHRRSSVVTHPVDVVAA